MTSVPDDARSSLSLGVARDAPSRSRGADDGRQMGRRSPAPDDERQAMRIQLNGEPYELERPLSIAALLERLQINPLLVAVEHNQTVVKRARYAETIVEEGSEVEIVNFVGGG